jgi:hypothetical protein
MTDSVSCPTGAPASCGGRRRACWGLAGRRERWGLTGRGWLLLVLALMGTGVGGVRWIHPFLAVTVPVAGPIVVVEAWVPPAVLKGVATHYRGDVASVFYCVGGPSEQAFDSLRIEDTSAAEAARFLQQYGLPGDRLKVVPSWVPRKDRTYASAVALREWFTNHGLPVTSLTVVTEGPHARRSRLMFEKAFGQGVEIGVVAISDPSYEAARWWQYSEGIKAVISETAGYVYARVLFRPEGIAGQTSEVGSRRAGSAPESPPVP